MFEIVSPIRDCHPEQVLPEARRAEALSEVEGATEAVPWDGRTERGVEGPGFSFFLFLCPLPFALDG